MQHNIIGWTAWLQLKPETDPAVGVVRSGIVARLDGVGKGKKAGLGAASFAELCLQVGPFFVHHRLKALLGNIS